MRRQNRIQFKTWSEWTGVDQNGPPSSIEPRNRDQSKSKAVKTKGAPGKSFWHFKMKIGVRLYQTGTIRTPLPVRSVGTENLLRYAVPTLLYT